jgi:hypothetical protein
LLYRSYFKRKGNFSLSFYVSVFRDQCCAIFLVGLIFISERACLFGLHGRSVLVALVHVLYSPFCLTANETTIIPHNYILKLKVIAK